MKNPFRTRYRVVRYAHLWYEAQCREWFLPFWIQLGLNTYRSVEEAESRIRQCNRVVKEVEL